MIDDDDSDDLAEVDELELERALLEDSFPDFLIASWDSIEPTRSLLPSIAIDALCAALGAVGAGRIRRLGVCCPPGVSKSLVAAVAFPAWLLLRSGGKARVMSGSYAWDLARRDSRRCRDLVTSTFYKQLVNGAWSVRIDADKQDDWWTSTSGRRLVTSTGAKTLGERATFQILDDVLSGADVYSEAKRREARRWLSEVLPSRLEDQDRDSRVLIGQRLHVDDPLSVAYEQGWKILTLPATLGENDTPCELYDDDGELVWRDTRAPGEPLVSLLSVEALARLKIELGSAPFSAQYQQKPHDDSSAMFPRAWLTRRWTVLPEQIDREVIALDASFKESDTADYAVIQRWAASGGDRLLVEQWRRQAGFVDTLAALKEMAARAPFAKVLVEAAANGHAILDQFRREVPGVVEVKPEGGKVSRAASVQAIAESGAIVLPANAPWVDAWIDEVSAFPHGAKNDDQTDACVYALRELQVAVDPRGDWKLLTGAMNRANNRDGAPATRPATPGTPDATERAIALRPQLAAELEVLAATARRLEAAGDNTGHRAARRDLDELHKLYAVTDAIARGLDHVSDGAWLARLARHEQRKAERLAAEAVAAQIG